MDDMKFKEEQKWRKMQENEQSKTPFLVMLLEEICGLLVVITTIFLFGVLLYCW